jgi:hypothetical protein
MSGDRSHRRKRGPTGRSIVNLVGFVAAFVLVAALVAAVSHRKFEWHTVLPYALAYPAYTTWRIRRAAERGGPVAQPVRERPRDLADAWAATWKVVLVHSVGGSLLLSLFWTTSRDLALRQTFALAAILLLPVFLCVVILDVGGALAGGPPN